MSNRNKKEEYLGKTYVTNEGYEVKVIDYQTSKQVTIQFPNGYCKTTNLSAVKRGLISSPFHPTVYQIGYLGVGKHKASVNRKHTHAYRIWHGMMARCYSDSVHKNRHTYEDCEVCPQWHNFQNFAQWYEDNYYEIGGQEMHLDKDVLIKGNKVYSPETCVFVPKSINNLLVKSDSTRGDSPIGVSYHKKEGVYYARCGNQFLRRTVLIGAYLTEKEAFKAYKEYKEQHIMEIANFYKGQIPARLYQALSTYVVDIAD